VPSPEEPFRGSLLRGWCNIIARRYACIYQDTRGRHGSEGEDHVYADDAADGHDTLEWIAVQPWTDQRAGMSGSSAGATTTLSAASTRHPSPRLFFLKPEDRAAYKPDDWVHAECWPPRGMRPMRLNLRGDGGIAEDGPVARRAATTTNRADQSPPWVGETC